MKKYPAPAPASNFQLNGAALAAELDLPVAPEFNPPPPRMDPRVILQRIAETMPWRNTRPGESERRLAQKFQKSLFFKVFPNARNSALPARADALKSNTTSERGMKKCMLFVSPVFLAPSM